MEYKGLKKDELIAECEARGLSTEGLVKDLLERLQADDAKKESESQVESRPKKSQKRFNSMGFRFSK